MSGIDFIDEKIEDPINQEINTKIEPILFGAEISFNIAEKPELFLYCDGFIDTKVCCVDIKESNKNIISFDYERTVFKILPFKNFSHFAHHRELDYKEIMKKMNEEKDQSKRKVMLKELEQKFSDELYTNISLYEKQKNTSISFATSDFQLIHKVSMKYLSQNDDDNDNLHFCLVDFPEERSFFRFQPSLKMQHQRNNIVYNNDQLFVCSSKSFVNQLPYVHVSKESRESSLVKNKVYASLEEHIGWKINLYSDIHVSEDEEFLKVGDVIYLQFSEKDVFIKVDLKNKAAKEIHNYIVTQKELDYKAAQGIQKFDAETKKSIEEIIGSIQDGANVCFETLSSDAGAQSLGVMGSEGFWKIEARNPIVGGIVSWGTSFYRFRHLITGKYQTYEMDGDNLVLKLTKDRTSKSLFSFHQLKSQNQNEANKKYVSKDSYFKLQCKNLSWIRQPYNVLDGYNNSGSAAGKEFKQDIVTQMDTQKAYISNQEEIWENNFLLACLPILLETIITFTDVNKDGETDMKLRKLEEFYHNIIFCQKSQTNFVLNKLPSNISSSEDFGSTSRKRQNIQTNIDICELLVELINVAFPDCGKTPVETRELIENFQAESLKNFMEEGKFAKLDKNKKTEFLFQKKRMVIVQKVYKLLKNCALYNQESQLFLSNFQNQLTKYIGYGDFVSNTLMAIVNNNDEILMNFSRQKSADTSGDNGAPRKKKDTSDNYTSFGLDFFAETIDKLKDFKPYKKYDILKFQEKLCYTSKKSYYLNQNSIQNAIKNPEIQRNYLIQIKVIDNELYVHFLRGTDKVQISLEEQISNQRWQTEKKFFKAQLNLYSALCKNRNGLSCDYVSRKFPLAILRDYLFKDDAAGSVRQNLENSFSVPSDLKATFLRLIIVVYIDRAPRRIIDKPELVRKLIPSDGADYVKPVPKGKNFMQNEEDDILDEQGLNIEFEQTAEKNKKFANPLNERSQENPLDNSINPLVNEEGMMIEEEENLIVEQSLEDKETILESIKERLVKMICERVEPQRNARHADKTLVSNVFSELALEEIRLMQYLQKFGYYGGELGDIDQQIGMMGGGDKKKKTNSSADSLNKIIRALSYLLEYDREYYEVLKSEKIQFQNWQNCALIGQSESYKSARTQPNYQTNRKGWSEMNTNELKAAARCEDFNFCDESVSKVSIFKKNFALKKVLTKFDNKTYSARIESDDTPIDVSIKTEIANVFQYLLDLRDDFLQGNAIKYFNKKYVVEYKENIEKLNINEDSPYWEGMTSIFPNLHFKGGENEAMIDQSSKTWCNYADENEVASFDKVIDRSFMEILIVSFYFSYDSIQQNCILKLLERFCTQRNSLMININKTVLICNTEASIIYNKINEINQCLQNYRTESQVWLLIIDKNFYQREYDFSLTGALKKLKLLWMYLTEDTKNKEQNLKIKQDMMRQIGCQDNIINFLSEGVVILDLLTEVFLNQEKAGKVYRLDIYEKICTFFTLCHEILTIFVKGNKVNQELMNNHIKQFTINERIDFKQIDLINELHIENKKNSQQISPETLKYYLNLIKMHGKNPIFLDIFQIILKYADSENSHIKKEIIKLIFNETYLNYIEPFKESIIKEEVSPFIGLKQKYAFHNKVLATDYEDKFIIILSHSQFKNIGINYITKAFAVLTTETLQQRARILIDSEKKLVHTKNIEQNHLSFQIDTKSGIYRLISSYIYSNSDGSLSTDLQIIFDQLIDQYRDEIHLYFEYIKRGDYKDYYIEFVIKSQLSLINQIASGMYQSSSYDSTKNNSIFNALQNFTQKIFQLLPELIKLRSMESDAEVLLTFQEAEIVKTSARIFNMNIDSLGEDFAFMKEDAGGSGLDDHPYTPMARKIEYKKQNNNVEKAKGTDENAPLVEQDTEIPKEFKWNTFKKILKQKAIKEIIVQEYGSQSETIIDFVNCFDYDIKKIDMQINREDILKSFLGYLRYWVFKGGTKKNVQFVQKCLRQIVSAVDTPDHIQAMQNIFDSLGATRNIILLVSNEVNTDKKYLLGLLKFGVMLLKDGNNRVQRTIYNFFLADPITESFFYRIFNILENEVIQIEASQSQSICEPQNQRFQTNLLEFLRLFSEGHFLELQTYLSVQRRSKKSYDIVETIAKMLSSVKVSEDNYSVVESIFDALTEFVQGPCKENQKTIAGSKFLEFVHSLLNDDPKIYHTGSDEGSEEGSGDKNAKSGENVGIETYKKEKLKFRALITLTALMEKMDVSESILTRIVRTIPIGILKKNLVDIYKRYYALYQDEYTTDSFYWYECEPQETNEIGEDSENPVNDKQKLKAIEAAALHKKKCECIIETGFGIFMLMLNCIDLSGEGENDLNDEEIDVIAKEINEIDIQNDGIFIILGKSLTNCMNFLCGCLKCACCRKSKKRQADSGNSEYNQNNESNSNQEEEKKDDEMLKKALRFFKLNVARIDIVRERNLEKVYFPVMPFCKYLTEADRLRFHEMVDRTSIKTKLNDLLSESENFYDVMMHENELRAIFNQYKLLKFLNYMGPSWDTLAFINAIINNMIILTYYDNSFADVYDLSGQTSKTALFICGCTLTLICTIMIFLHFLKRYTIITKGSREKYDEDTIGITGFKKCSHAIGYAFGCLWDCQCDSETLYYSLYWLFAVLGITASMSFQIWHQVKLLRNDVQKNVVDAILNKLAPMALSFMLFQLIEYYYTILGYTYYYYMYPNQRCLTLWNCFLENFDLTFKEGGGTGSQLDNLWELPRTETYVRFLWDNTLGLILIHILLNMVAGLIIDEFAAQKENQFSRKDDMIEMCFICGINRDKLDKASGFVYHYKTEHNMWNYVYYYAYQKNKDENDHTGTETFVNQKINCYDFEWFPIKRAFNIVNENESELEKQQLIKDISSKMTTIERLSSNLLTKMDKIHEKDVE